jgi:hypothetical protein
LQNDVLKAAGLTGTLTVQPVTDAPVDVIAVNITKI